MGYDSRSTLVTRLEAVRSALNKARTAVSVKAGDSEVTRSYRELRREEKEILAQINAIDARSSGGTVNKVQFGRRS